MSKKAEGFSLRFVLINTGNISRKVLSKVLRSFDKNFERLQRERDQKGLYSKLENGKIKNVSGMDLQVEFPKTPDITVRNDGSRTVADVVKEIMGFQPQYRSDFDRDTGNYKK